MLPLTLFAQGTLGPDVRISSKILGYDLQYRVYQPEGYEARENHPVLYVTDGQWYISQGKMIRVLDRVIADGNIEPTYVVFVDSRDPNNLGENLRRKQFPCNYDYYEFYAKELVPEIEATHRVAVDREKRGILGVSFGGLNAACFGLMGYQTFSRIGMHSPANHPVPELLPTYEEAPTLPLKIFLSTGDINDNTAANRRFRNLLREKGYDLKYVETHQAHNWKNWRPLIDDVLKFFFPPVTDTVAQE